MSTKKYFKGTIFVIVIVLIVASLLLIFRPFSQEPPKAIPTVTLLPETPSNGDEESQLAISSFESEVLGELQAFLELEIFDYGVKGNQVVCFGRVYLVRGGEVSGAAVGMFITEAPRNSVNVEVDVYQGQLMLPNDAIDFNEVNIPTLTSDNTSFEFSLTCTYR